MARYAILWDLEGEESQPIGLAVEKDDYVLVELPDDHGIPTRYEGSYNVLQPDASRITYRPGDAGYFEQVLIDLSRVYAIGKQAEEPVADDKTVLRLLTENVFRPRENARVGVYERRPMRAPEPVSALRYGCGRRRRRGQGRIFEPVHPQGRLPIAA